MTAVPSPVDAGTAALAAAYWETVAAAGELQVQGCPWCGGAQFPPRLRCAGCGAGALEWWGAGTAGELVAVVVVAGEAPRHRPAKRFRSNLPYATGIVRPDAWPDVRLPVLLLGDDASSALGRVTFALEGFDGAPTPIARRTDEAPAG